MNSQCSHDPLAEFGEESDGRGGERKDSEGHRKGDTEGEPYRYFEAGGSISFSLMFSVVYANITILFNLSA